MHQPGARPGDLPAGPDPDLYGRLALETGPDRRREQAFDAAWRFLAHRDRTEAEVRARLERNDVDPELVDDVLDVLREGRYVDDAGFARRFAEDRRTLDGWGGERIERRLIELGVAREHIRAALAGHDELGAACELLARRFPVPPDSPRELERALGFLVRKGYELELAHDALRRHAAAR
jgi:regulatory protein